jgi:hypothetical protein
MKNFFKSFFKSATYIYPNIQSIYNPIVSKNLLFFARKEVVIAGVFQLNRVGRQQDLVFEVVRTIIF